MISIESGDFGADGVADLEDAVALARTQGIANARGAVNPEILYDLLSLSNMTLMGLQSQIPGVVGETARLGGVSGTIVDAHQTVEPLKLLAQTTESAIQRVAGDSLPNWNPTLQIPGVRIVTMWDGAKFRSHTDDYEGLVASVQLLVDGTKTMHTSVFGQEFEEDIRQGDITLFAGDTFSEQSRRPHGFSFAGFGAVALIIGQDPFYTISGHRPFIAEHPQYFTDNTT